MTSANSVLGWCAKTVKNKMGTFDHSKQWLSAAASDNVAPSRDAGRSDTTLVAASYAQEYSALHVVAPSRSHRQTILMVHGLGDSGPRFEAAFFGSKMSSNLRQRFPHARWVFPSAPIRHVDVGNNNRPAWFNLSSLTDLEEGQQSQIDGLRQSTIYLSHLIEKEILKLEEVGGAAKDLFVIARSQGSSAIVWTLLSSLKRTLGGLVLAGSWLVFARALISWMDKCRTNKEDDRRTSVSGEEDAITFVSELLSASKAQLLDGKHSLQHVPILLGHCTNDIWIDVDLGRQMRDCLQHIGCNVTWHEYAHAADEGHWLAEPDEFDCLADFIEHRMAHAAKSI